jgi:hypothetical protein
MTVQCTPTPSVDGISNVDKDSLNGVPSRPSTQSSLAHLMMAITIPSIVPILPFRYSITVLLAVWTHGRSRCLPGLTFTRAVVSRSQMISVRERPTHSLWSVLLIKILELVRSSRGIFPVDIDVEDERRDRCDTIIELALPTQYEQTVTYNPSSVNVNNALYILHTMIPMSSCQCLTSHMFANVPLINHVSRLQLTAQMTRRKPLTARLKRGFKPTQQCRTIVSRSAAIENSEAADSYTI